MYIEFVFLYSAYYISKTKISMYSINKKLISFLIIKLLLFVAVVNSQDTAKIMTYNLLNYNGSTIKDQSFRKVINYVKPDIIVTEETISQSAVNNFVSNVLNYYSPGLYTAGTFLNGYDTDNAIFFKSSKFTFLYNFAIQTTLRTINLFGLVHTATGDTLKLFAVHLKASNTTSDQQQRLSEVNVLRNFTNTLPLNSEFIVLGDFNIYTSLEPAYLRLLQVDAGVEGHFIDPLNLTGTWNQSSYSSYHTQSTRTRALSDSGSTGGLDDRFDMILNSKAMTEEGRIKYIPGSLKPVGNDGNHYNDSINKRPNNAVPDSIADALYYGSDHLPVTALYKFDVNTISVSNNTTSIPGKFRLYQNYPNPFNPETKIKFDLPADFRGIAELKIFNSAGKEIDMPVNEYLNSGSYEYVFKTGQNTIGFDYTSGVYFYRLTLYSDKFNSGSFSETKSMVLIK